MKQLKPKSLGQQEYLRAMEKNKIVFATGPAGSGKTALASRYGIVNLLDGKYSKLIISRPLVQAGEETGFLPGDINDKLDPYTRPVYDELSLYIQRNQLKTYIEERIIEVVPLAYMRGRAQPVDSNVMTPTGYKTIGSLNIGDEVIGSDGKPTKIIAIHPQGIIDVYKMVFSDGTSTECSSEHLWLTQTMSESRSNTWKLRDTKSLVGTVKNKHNQKIHKIPIARPIQFNKQDVVISPYILGALLGDGCFTGNSIGFTSADEGILNRIKELLPDTLNLVHRDGYGYVIVNNNKDNVYIDYLRELGLWGHLGNTKFIPDIYKFNSVDIRLEVLRGLLDTDGCIFKHRSGNPRIQFSSISEQLVDDVAFLVTSLGGVVHKRKRIYTDEDIHTYNGKVIKHKHNSYVLDIIININPFFLSRKANQFKEMNPKRLISEIKHVGKKNCVCITIDNDNGLYLTNDAIVTHNSFHNAFILLDEMQNATFEQIKMAITRFGRNSKMVINGDMSQSDLPIHKRGALLDIIQKLGDIPNVSVITLGCEDIVREEIISEILQRLDK